MNDRIAPADASMTMTSRTVFCEWIEAITVGSLGLAAAPSPVIATASSEKQDEHDDQDNER